MRYNKDGKIKLPQEFYGKIESIEVTLEEKLLVHVYAISEQLLETEMKNIGDIVSLIATDEYKVHSFYFEIDQKYKNRISYNKSYVFHKESGGLVEGVRSLLYAEGDLPSIDNSDSWKEVYILKEVDGRSKLAKQLNKVSCFSKIEDQLTILKKDNIKEAGIFNFLNISYMCVQNVGQGSTNLFLDEKSDPLFYIDVGFQNESFEFKHENSKKCPIFLTHWDIDHYKLLEYFAYKNDEFKNIIIAPFQLNAGPKAVEIVVKLQKKGVKIYLVDINHEEEIEFGSLNLVKSSSTVGNQDKNEKSFYYFIKEEENSVLIAGDCRYEFIKDKYRNDLDALVAYHHGGEYRKKEYTPLAKGEEGEAYFSAGDNKKYEHPRESSIKNHQQKKWNTNSTRDLLPFFMICEKIGFLYSFKNKSSYLCCY